MQFYPAMQRVPKFILSDAVCPRKFKGTPTMHIQKFITIIELNTNKRIYTGLICCYWYENQKVKKGVFHEDELELAKFRFSV